MFVYAEGIEAVHIAQGGVDRLFTRTQTERGKQMKKITRITALLLALLMTVLCASCSGDENETTTAAAETELSTAQTETESAYVSPTETETSTEAVFEIETRTEAQTEGATQAATETASAVQAPVGGTIAEIVTFYNDSANATKAYVGKVKINKKDGTTSVLDDISVSWLRGIAEGKLPNDYPRDKSATFTKGKASDGASVKDFIPIVGNAKMSSLPAAGVSKAACVATANGWKVTLTLKSETGNDINYKPPYHAACMDTLALTAEDLAPFTLNNATVTYKGATLTAEINKDGLLTSFNVSEPVRVEGNFGYKSLNILEAVIEGVWHQTLTFTY